MRWGLAFTFGIGSLLFTACQSAPTPGTACARSTDCASPLACRFGRCRAECSANRDCGPTQSCIFGTDHVGSCQLDVDLGCETGVGRMCPAGLFCASDRCVNPCSTSADCPSDGECLFAPAVGQRVCVDPRRVGPADAGIALDGAPISSPCQHITDLCMGDQFACAVVDGRVHCWGDDNANQHGDLGGTTGFAPSLVIGPDQRPLDGVVQVSCGWAFACARTGRGDVLCWGDTTSDQLAQSGAGDHANYVIADLALAGMALDAQELIAGDRRTCLRRGADREWACWGDNTSNVLEDGAPGTTPAVRSLIGLRGATTLGFGAALGAIADGSGVRVRGVPAVPTPLSGDAAALATHTGVTQIVFGAHHACMLEAGGVWCWGEDGLGQLGDGDVMLPLDPSCGVECSATPVTVSLQGATAIASNASSDTTCALVDGTARCWGQGSHGSLGPANAAEQAPVTIDGITNVCTLAVGHQTICAVMATASGDEVRCWGDNGTGLLADTPDGDEHPPPGNAIPL